MLVSEDNGPYESISDGVRALSDAKVEEDRLGSYLLSTGAHGIPAHFVEYYAYFVHLVPLYVDGSVEHDVEQMSVGHAARVVGVGQPGSVRVQ